ncbi:hypothetical protein AB1N83_013419 [Pleurotus pulmonarius]
MDKHNDEEIRGDTVELDSDPQAPKVYRIQAIPSKGLGVVAAIDLAPGDLIIVESPLFLFRPEGAMIYKDLLQRAFDKLDDGKKEAFMKLDNAHPETEYPPLVGIFNTNAYDVQKSDHADSDVDSPYIAVFNDISRINHSCSPNTIRLWRAPHPTRPASASDSRVAGLPTSRHGPALRRPRPNSLQTLWSCWRWHLMCISYVMGEGDGMGSKAEAEGYEGYRRMLRAWRLANGAEEEEVERVEQADVEMMRAAISMRNTDS